MKERPGSGAPDEGRAVVSGLAAGSAYLVSMWVDNKLSSQRFNDIKLVGQLLTTRSPLWQIQGVLGHFGFSVMMALLYARFFYERLPGPGWLRGIIFLNIENALLYPLALPLDKLHAGMKAGEVPGLFGRKVFLGQVMRHVVFGAVLGLLYRPRG
jgi:hypothetical protein